VDRVLSILRDRETYRVEAAQRVGEWLRFHSPQHLLQRVDESVKQLRTAA
jgi:hypothetical protein